MNYPYIDMHCDTLFRGHQFSEESIYSGEGMQSIRQMCDAGQMAQFYAIFFPPAGDTSFVPADCRALPGDQEFYDLLRTQLDHLAKVHSDEFALARSASDLRANWSRGLSSAVLTIEDGRLVAGDMDKLREMYSHGVRAIALTWNFPNCFGFPNSKDPAVMEKGLTEFGKDAVREMNHLGMLVDVSHLSDGGFRDVAQISEKPFIASHSNCRALTNHPRNLTDEMIRTLAEKGGAAGLNLYSCFVSPDPESRVSHLEDMVRHALHMIDVGGEEILGIGSDFDGMDCELDIEHPSEMDRLFDALKKQGITERQLDKIASGNVLRVMTEVMG